eukprot:CAMPEP_0169127150 /NCGR_PEP_ID=MMETSP1015-20121227/35848_1 /TAXON_ID=342587 /ORGANISM="Karlodinium micrum, Strain CCMP2283" /LENGTH=158 /DNA_ID=CAMNT_0009190901 /DNA_START=154 /DNA_END=627 /DNA_ORIENTATION=+
MAVAVLRNSYARSVEKPLQQQRLPNDEESQRSFASLLLALQSSLIKPHAHTRAASRIHFSQPVTMQEAKKIGTVHSYNAKTGMGFVKPADGGDDLVVRGLNHMFQPGEVEYHEKPLDEPHVTRNKIVRKEAVNVTKNGLLLQPGSFFNGDEVGVMKEW